MKKVFLSFCTTIIMLCSCTSDYGLDVLDYEMSSWSTSKEKNNWMNQLTLILSDNSKVLYNSGISLLETELLDNDLVVDSLDFIGNKEICFPAYYRGFDRFDPVPFSFIQKGDSVMTHVSANHIRDIVNNVVINQDDYRFVLLTWSCDGVFEFKTIAVFDKQYGELVYDNLLSNLVDYEMLKSRTKQISRGEGANSNSPTFVEFEMSTSYENQYKGKATYKIDVDVLAHEKRTIRVENDDIIGYWLDFYFDGFNIDEEENYYCNYYAYCNYSVDIIMMGKNQCEADFKIWVGDGMPTGSYYTTAENVFTDISGTNYSAKLLKYRLRTNSYPVTF